MSRRTAFRPCANVEQSHEQGNRDVQKWLWKESPKSPSEMNLPKLERLRWIAERSVRGPELSSTEMLAEWPKGQSSANRRRAARQRSAVRERGLGEVGRQDGLGPAWSLPGGPLGDIPTLDGRTAHRGPITPFCALRTQEPHFLCQVLYLCLFLTSWRAFGGS